MVGFLDMEFHGPHTSTLLAILLINFMVSTICRPYLRTLQCCTVIS